MERRVRMDVPQTTKQFFLEWPFLEDFRKKDESYKKNKN